ncbi:MAG TPA: hypothetical protein VF773_07410 [Verrucomicrobiae bacterium]
MEAIRDNKLGSKTFEVRSVDVLYSPAGTVEEFLYNADTIVGKTGRSWRLGSFISDDDLERVVKNATTAEELTEYFGPPNRRGLNLSGDVFLGWEYQEGRGSLRKARQVNFVIDTNSVVIGIYKRDYSPEDR